MLKIFKRIKVLEEKVAELEQKLATKPKDKRVSLIGIPKSIMTEIEKNDNKKGN